MAWTAVENFNSYSDGDLNGDNGGSGWSAGWVMSSGTINVEGTVVYEGAKAVSCFTASSTTSLYTRLLTTAISDNGIVYIAMRKTSTADDNHDFQIMNNSTGARAIVRLTDVGTIVLIGTTNATVNASYNTNAWYVIRLTFNVAGNSATAAYNTGTGWSAESSSVTMTNSGNIDKVSLRYQTSGSGTGGYWDTITGTDPVVSNSGGFLLFFK